MPVLLEMENVSKSFPGVRALKSVSFDLRAGEVHALMGENGAGKSTLIKILSGVQPADAGTVRVDGHEVEVTSPARASQLGISTVHQELHLEPYMSVAENIFIGRQPLNRFGLIDRRRLNRDAAKILDDLGVSLDPAVQLGGLSVAERQVVAIAHAVSTKARVMILDEPTSSLTKRETELLLALIRRVRDQGIGVVYVSHRMEEIFALCDRVTVFRDGQHVGTKAVTETSAPEIIHMMIGRHLETLFRKEAAPIGKIVLEVRRVSKRGLLRDISFSLREGEIVGMAGLVGAGRTELARTIFGDITADEGAILIDGRPVRIRNPREAISHGIGLVPEDRKEQGLVTTMSVRQNISMPQLPSLTRLAVLSRGREATLARDYVERLAIKTPTIDQKAMLLSGGNQQRVVIAKWLATRPKVLIVDEPTRGVDVGAKAEIHRLLCDLAGQGMAILLISSDLPEVLAISDRILVMAQGRLSGELSREGASQEAVMQLAMKSHGSAAA